MPRKKQVRSSASRSAQTPRGTLSPITWPNGRPSEIIDDVMAGRRDLADQTGSIRSACSFAIYLAAKKIMAKETRNDRLDALNELPKLVRPYVKREVEKLWVGKKSLKY